MNLVLYYSHNIFINANMTDMKEVRLPIKNMVCPRCIRVVREELEAAGLHVVDVSLGEATIQSEDDIDLEKVRKVLTKAGFELIDDKNNRLIERIKTLIIEIIHHGREKSNLNFSDIIAREIGKDYHSLSALFSATENTTIEKFIISQKIEKVKELLFYNELTLSEIAWKLDYSSSAHLSAQFKQVTGMTPSQFKKNRGKHSSIDNI